MGTAEVQEEIRKRSGKTCCGVNCSHLKVIMMKDSLMLRRQMGCTIALMLCPIMFAIVAVIPIILGDVQDREGSLFVENFMYSNNQLGQKFAVNDASMPAFTSSQITLTNCLI